MCDLLAQTTEVGYSILGQSVLFSLWQGLWPYLMMILGFSAIIFVHELGHFAVAKWAGVRVERFALGFGKEVFGFTYGETRYSVNFLPLGGYVKMLGQEDFDDKAKELQFNDNPRSFVNKPVGHRMAIVSAGVIMNILFSFVLFMIVFMVGMQAIGKRIGYVEPDSPAEKAGLLPGDDILAINGDRVLEFRDVPMAIQLAPPHVPIRFDVARNGKKIDPLLIIPDYRRPEYTQGMRRQLVGIAPGRTQEIRFVGPGIDITKENSPHPGDMIVELDGVEVTKENVNQMLQMLPVAERVVVERKDPKDDKSSPKRVLVEIPPQLLLYPSDSKDPRTVSVLGLTPLARFGSVDRDSRAELAGLDIGDTILSWDDIPYPSRATIKRSIRHNAERDIAFKVQKHDGQIVPGFVRPEANRNGPATIQSHFKPIPEIARSANDPKVVVEGIPSFGVAARAGMEAGDLIVQINDITNPTAIEVSHLIRKSRGELLTIGLKKPDGRRVSITVTPIVPGSIDATYRLVANDVLITGEVVEQIHGKPSPASEAGVPVGSRIAKVNGEDVAQWQELVDKFRKYAGTMVNLDLLDAKNNASTVKFRVPHSLRTAIGVGPGARIVSIDGRSSVITETNRGDEEVQIGYHEGTREMLSQLVGQENVPVEYRSHPLAEVQTAYINVTKDMTDPWLGRVVFAPNLDVVPETFLLKGENAIDAISIGVHRTYAFIIQVYTTIKRMVFTDRIGVENMSGPLGIVSIGGQIAQAGIVEFLYFLAIISANLAVINFLPMPIVDGGLMVFLIIEKIKGSPVSLRVQIATQMIGLCLFVGIFLFVTYNDVIRIWG